MDSKIKQEIENIILPILKNKRTYLDIGANRGKSSIPFVDIFDRVIAFEPNTEAINILKEHSKIQVEEFAVSNFIGKAQFVVPGVERGNEWGSIAEHKIDEISMNYEQLNKYKVKVTTIDSYKFSDVDFIKIDTEGNEINVLKGAIETIKENRPIIYYENKNPENNKYTGDIDSLFEELGYKTKRMQKFWRKDKQPKADMLAMPKEDLISVYIPRVNTDLSAKYFGF